MFATVFSIVPLSWAEWQLVILWSFPVIMIDEVWGSVGGEGTSEVCLG